MPADPCAFRSVITFHDRFREVLSLHLAYFLLCRKRQAKQSDMAVVAPNSELALAPAAGKVPLGKAPRQVDHRAGLGEDAAADQQPRAAHQPNAGDLPLHGAGKRKKRL